MGKEPSTMKGGAPSVNIGSGGGRNWLKYSVIYRFYVLNIIINFILLYKQISRNIYSVQIVLRLKTF